MDITASSPPASTSPSVVGEQPPPSPDQTDSQSSSKPSEEETSEDVKLPMREFKWGVSFVIFSPWPVFNPVAKGTLLRSTLPTPLLPLWLSPTHVDIDDPRRLPLCWYGIHYLPKYLYEYAERAGFATYLRRDHFLLKAGTLDASQTWINLTDWFERKSGLEMHLRQVWGESDSILTFFSNHELRDVNDEKWGQVCDLLDAMEYPWEYQPQWYLDRRLEVCACISLADEVF